MNKRKLLSVILATCMMVSLIPTVAFAEDSDVDASSETEYYYGDGTVYVPEDYAVKEECWDLNTKSEGSVIYMTKDDKLTWESEMETTGGGTHGSDWCYFDQDACGHYGEPSYNHWKHLGFRLNGNASTLENLDAPLKVYSVDAVDETAMESYGTSKTRPANTMTKNEYEVVDSVTVLNYPTKIIYKERGERKESHKRCGIINNANEYIAYDNYYYYVGGLLEVDSLSINEFPVKYNLQGGIMESGKTLPSKFLITADSYRYEGSEPVRLGYEFNGWDNEDNEELKYVYGNGSWIGVYKLSEKWDTIETEAATGSTIIARWLPSTVSISLDPNGGTIYGEAGVMSLRSINYDSEAGKDTSYLAVVPEKNGNEFLGWYIGDTKITCIDEIPQTVWNSNNSYTLTAKWNNKVQESPQHKHSLKKTDAKAATCVEAGNKEYWTCSDCKKIFADAEGKTETTVEKMTILATGVPEKGTEIQDPKGTASYKVTGSDANNPTVTYTGTTASTTKTVTIPATITVDGVTYKVTAIADSAFKSNKTITKVTIPKNVTTIGKNAFNGCTKLKTVTIGDSVTSIGANAFKGCKVLTKVTIPSKVTTIGSNAFNGCTKLKTVTVGSNVTTIGSGAFKGCKALTKITLPSKTTKIGANAFNGCIRLKTITIKSKKLTGKSVSSNAFKGVSPKVTIKVPGGKVKTYKSLFQKKGLSKKVKVK